MENTNHLQMQSNQNVVNARIAQIESGTLWTQEEKQRLIAGIKKEILTH